MCKITVVLSEYRHHKGGNRIGIDDDHLDSLDIDIRAITEDIYDHCLDECWRVNGIPITKRAKFRIKTILECHNVEVIFK